MGKAKKGGNSPVPNGANLPKSKKSTTKPQQVAQSGSSKGTKIAIVLALLSVVIGLGYYHTMNAGVFASPFCTYLKVNCPVTFVEGFVVPGYEPVRDVFVAMKERGDDLGSQLSVWVHGREVVNLWGGYKDWDNTKPYKNNTLNVIYSSGKVVTSLVMAVLADRGLIEYEAPIVKYWPEFAASCNGSSDCEKAKITIQDMMSMSGKIPYMEEPNPNSWEFLRDLDRVKRSLEISPLIDTTIEIQPGVGAEDIDKAIDEADMRTGQPFSKERCYHAVTRGLIAQQILKIVDPKHRSFGDFIKEEILDPLNNNKHADVDPAEHYVSLPENQHHRMATLYDMPFTHEIVLFVKYVLHKVGVYQAEPSLVMSLDLAFNPKSVVSIVLAMLNPKFNAATCSSPNYWTLHSPDAASTTNAHSMAMLGAVLAGKGALNNTRILSEKGVERALESRGRIPDFYYGGLATPAWTAAGWSILDDGYSKINGEGWYGTGGFGGSVNAFNPKYGASIAFSMNGMVSSIDLRYNKLTDALMQILDAKK